MSEARRASLGRRPLRPAALPSLQQQRQRQATTATPIQRAYASMRPGSAASKQPHQQHPPPRRPSTASAPPEVPPSSSSSSPLLPSATHTTNRSGTPSISLARAPSGVRDLESLSSEIRQLKLQAKALGLAQQQLRTRGLWLEREVQKRDRRIEVLLGQRQRQFYVPGRSLGRAGSFSFSGGEAEEEAGEVGRIRVEHARATVARSLRGEIESLRAAVRERDGAIGDLVEGQRAAAAALAAVSRERDEALAEAAGLREEVEGLKRQPQQQPQQRQPVRMSSSWSLFPVVEELVEEKEPPPLPPSQALRERTAVVIAEEEEQEEEQEEEEADAAVPAVAAAAREPVEGAQQEQEQEQQIYQHHQHQHQHQRQQHAAATRIQTMYRSSIVRARHERPAGAPLLAIDEEEEIHSAAAALSSALLPAQEEEEERGVMESVHYPSLVLEEEEEIEEEEQEAAVPVPPAVSEPVVPTIGEEEERQQQEEQVENEASTTGQEAAFGFVPIDPDMPTARPASTCSSSDDDDSSSCSSEAAGQGGVLMVVAAEGGDGQWA